MSGRKNHGNNSKRFDVNSFYAYIKKAHIEELLDADGNTPFDSESIDKSVWDYAAYLYKDIQNYGGLLSYFDSDSFRDDSDGSGNNTWSAISKTSAVTKVYKPLKRWLYSLDSEDGINNTIDLITGGFNRRYYTLPLSDSEGTVRHVNIYTFLKSHFDRWLQFDPYERKKLSSRIIDNLEEDSDQRYQYANQIIRAVEEDSDLQRRLVELISNVLQTDSEVRNEILRTTITAFQNDSDKARELVEIISAVLETDSEIRNEFGDHFLVSLRNDSDQQVELGFILSSHEFTELNTDKIYARQVLPMDGDDTGNIGDSDNKWSLGNFETIRTDTLKVRGLDKDRIVYVSDSEGTLATHKDLQWQNDSELITTRLTTTVDTTLASTRVTDLDPTGVVFVSNDSENRLITSNNLRFTNDTLYYMGRAVLPIDSEMLKTLLVENIDSEFSQYVGLDSEAVEKIIGGSTVLSQVAVPVGDRGNIYYIDSDNTNKLVNGPLIKIGNNRENYYISPGELSEALSRHSEHESGDVIWDLDLQNPDVGGAAYVHDSDGAGNKSWTLDSNITINGGINEGRIVHNPNTKKTFYNDGVNKIHELGTARDFSDVIVMQPLTGSPDSDTLGKEGLRPGTIAVADGTNWDPGSIGGATPYPVFWDGGQWLYFSMF